MHGRKHHRLAALLTAAVAFALFAGSAQAADSRPAGMTKPEYRALMLRSVALNRHYGPGSGTSAPAAMGRQDYRALGLRSKALNAKYGLAGAHTGAPPAAFFAASVQPPDSRPAGITKGEYRALMLRSVALNRRYGLGSGTSMPAAMGWHEYRALGLRSNAMNAKYGLGDARVVAATPSAATPSAVSVAESGFVSGDFAIGAAAMLGLVLVATGVFAATRRLPRARVSS